ncbi:uncharacterized protein LOC135194631 [Vanessa tameamea]|uniref:Uncharacterized protein LOC135194631 n=1 Tax=Vanessa tameamea TaxID=334116 RepID=A0ABM4AYH8_VANTA
MTRQYKTKCFKCRALLQRIRDLIDNITVIHKNETLGICDYCKRSSSRNKCKRCEYYMQTFLSNETKRITRDSDSILECEGNKSSCVTEMVKGRTIVPFQKQKPEPVIKKIPLLFQIQHDFNLPTIDTNISLTSNDIPENALKSTDTKTKGKSIKNKAGIIRYQLSNREFIDKGWTKLPSIKVLRRTNVYNMVPSYSKFDWFKNHKNEKMLCYESSEKLAEIHEDGCGKWFYKNGNTALDYYSTPELNLGKRCIIYSSHEENLQNKKSLNVIASFDYLGNGVVYDNSGKVRLKYNQTEGFVIDKNIGPPSHWMWHTLNEPPVLFPVFCDTFVENKPYSYLKNKKVDDELYDFELGNYRKEKAAKMQQPYKPFQIRIKVVKINDYFSLRIVNQSKIYIQFRCEHICLKLNVGMFLKNKEIIDSDFAVVSEISTSCDFSKNV